MRTLQVRNKFFFFFLIAYSLIARSGYLDILKYLESMELSSSFDLTEQRFDLSPLTIALAMKHFPCVDFLAQRVSQSRLDAGLISGCSEGKHLA